MVETKYIGTRTERGCQVVKEVQGEAQQLDPRLDLWGHSPTGYAEFAVILTFP